MDDPARAERLWMAIAIATWWLLSVGGDAEAQADTPVGHQRTFGSWCGTAARKRWRIVGIFPAWLVLIIAAACLNHRLLAVKPGRPEHGQGAR